MKRVSQFILGGAMLFTTQNLIAQEWTIGGDPNPEVPAAGGQFGTNGNRSVIFETNGIERARMLNTSGFWGFGIPAPAAQVHINSTLAGTNPLQIDVVGVARMIVNNNGLVGIGTTAPDARLHIDGDGGENALRVRVGGLTKLLVSSSGGVTIGINTTPPANGLFVSGNAGIGTNIPVTKLQVTGGVDASLTGNGFIVNGPTTGVNLVMDDNEIIARNNGAASALTFNNNGGNVIINGANAGGSVGIGTASPANRFHVKQAIANRAIEFEHESTTDFWTVGIGTVTLNCRFEFNGIGKGQISSTDGAYSQISDARLKEEVEPLSTMLDKIMKLKPSSYYYKDSRSSAKNKSIGFIAQDVEKIFPELVRNEDKGYKWLNYSEFAVIAIKGLQELPPVIEEQKLKIATLEERIAKLESALNAITSKTLQGFDAASVVLEQNQPNPFNNTTIIRYRVPAGANAQINVYDASGAMVKTMRAPESGQAQINAGELKAGTYTYALVVDGKPLASKKMIMLK